MGLLELDGITRRFGDTTAVDDVSLSVEAGELVCLLGPSGCGKSTALRTIAGLETPDSGSVRIDGDDVTAAPAHRRDCSLVFQDWALFPNKTVLENVAFGPKMAGVDSETRRDRAREMLALVEMDGHADADPTALSGGQKQRVALARSLAVDPTLLLLDEPLSNLDRQLRETMQLELADIHADLGTTMVYVTHDQDEAFTLADRIGVMRDGSLVQVGPPERVYEAPANRFVESFLGSTTFVDCTVAATGDGVVLDTPLGTTHVPLAGDGLTTGDPVVASVRPEAIAVGPSGDPTAADGGAESANRARPTVEARVDGVVHRGSTVRYRLTVGETTLFTERRTAERLDVAAGDTVGLRWLPGRSVYFDTDGRRLQ